MKSRGSVAYWCDCPPGTRGQKKVCRRPTERGHRHWYWAIRLDATGRDDVQVKRGGYATQTAATAVLEDVRALLAVAAGDDGVRRRIADVVIARSRRGGTLPDLDEVRRRYGAGVDPVAPTTTTGEWLDEWLAGKRRADERTRDKYRLWVDNYWRPHVGDVPLDRLRGSHVAGVLDWIEERNATILEARAAGERPPADPLDRRRHSRVVGAETQRQIVLVLSMALNAAIRRRLLTFNACHEIDAVEASRSSKARVWSPDQVATFVGGTADQRLAALFRLVLLRGPRRGEACGLRWADVDLDARQLTIRRTMHFAGPKRGVGVGQPKTDLSERTLSLDAGTADALRRVKARQRRERLAAGPAWRGAEDLDGDWVFARPDGSPEPPPAVTLAFQRLAASLGLPVIRLHDARHTAATLGFEAGVPLKVVSEQLGHASTRITNDTYTHVRRALHDQAAETVANLLAIRTNETEVK